MNKYEAFNIFSKCMNSVENEMKKINPGYPLPPIEDIPPMNYFDENFGSCTDKGLNYNE